MSKESPAQSDGRAIVKGSLWVLFARVFPLVFGLFALPIIVSTMGKAEFAILTLIWAVTGQMGMFDMGVGRAATKFVASALGKGDAHAVPGIIWTAILIQLALGALGAVAVLLAAPLLVEKVFQIPPELIKVSHQAFQMTALAVPLVLLAGTLRGVLEADMRFGLVSLVRVPATLLTLAVPLVGGLRGLPLDIVVLGLVLTRFGAVIAYACMLIKVVPGLGWRPTPQRESLKPMLNFGGWVSVSNFAGPILGQLERFFLGAFLPMASLAFYAAPMEALSRLLVLPSSLATALFPAMSRDQPLAEMRAMANRASTALFAIMLPAAILLIVFSNAILLALFGSDFASEATIVFAMLAAVILLNAMAMIPYTVLHGTGHPAAKAKMDLLELPIFSLLCWYGVSHYGLIGAAGAKVVITILDLILLTIAANARLGPSHQTRIAGNLGRTFLGGIGFGLVLTSLHGMSLGLILLGSSIAGFAYLIALFTWCLHRQDREALVALIPARFRVRLLPQAWRAAS
jgi:O-antigen/teichoic acid export membrane protein